MPSSGIAGSYASFIPNFFFFKGISLLFSIVAVSIYIFTNNTRGLSGGSDSNGSACNMGDPGSVPGLGRSPGEVNGNPLQYSCLENSMGRAVWQAIVITNGCIA